jgi:thioredoxin-dependent peroxiredoxin
MNGSPAMLSLFTGDPLAPGTPAPPFILPDEEGNVFILNQQRGKNVILIFYPGDNTPVCTKQLCEVRDQWEALLEKNVVVFGVNPQPAQSHTAFRSKHQLPFPLLVDAGKRVAKLYKAGGLIINRTVYLVGPDGVIRYAKRGKPSISEVLQAAQ